MNVITVPAIAHIVKGTTGIILFQAISNFQKYETVSVTIKLNIKIKHFGNKSIYE